MMVIETCPNCGKNLTNEIITTFPPIPIKKCYHCGYFWEGEREEIIYKPFTPSTEEEE